jgi:hypothetical protein
LTRSNPAVGCLIVFKTPRAWRGESFAAMAAGLWFWLLLLKAKYKKSGGIRHRVDNGSNGYAAKY